MSRLWMIAVASAALSGRANVDVVIYGDRAWVSSYRDNIVYAYKVP